PKCVTSRNPRIMRYDFLDPNTFPNGETYEKAPCSGCAQFVRCRGGIAFASGSKRPADDYRGLAAASRCRKILCLRLQHLAVANHFRELLNWLAVHHCRHCQCRARSWACGAVRWLHVLALCC